MSAIDPLIIRAYNKTDYCVSAQPPFILRVGVASQELAALYKKTGSCCAAFITACNPFSERCDEQTNAEKQTELAKELKLRSLSFIEGIGKHPNGDWPAEASYFILNLSLATARRIAYEYDQNAIIWCSADAIPELVLLR